MLQWAAVLAYGCCHLPWLDLTMRTPGRHLGLLDGVQLGTAPEGGERSWGPRRLRTQGHKQHSLITFIPEIAICCNLN